MPAPPKIQTPITEMLGIDYPIIAAPMFLISDKNLITAACEAGATGAFPALNFRPVERFREEVQSIKKRTQKAFGVNLIVQSSNKHFEDQLEVCVSEKVPYLITSLGSPQRTIEQAHAHGLKVFCDVTNLEHAKKAVDLGADALIAVCSGAGGHAGPISAFALIPTLLKAFSIPVIAAGSIADGSTCLSALSLGASAVYMGTRFIASKEADAPGVYKRAIIDSDCVDIVNTDRVDGFPGNFIRTKEFSKYVKEAGLVETLLSTNPSLKRTLALMKAGKSMFGDPKKLKASYKTVFSAGHGVGAIEEVESVQEIIHNTVKGYFEAKDRLP